jgi:hypothetical protein
MCAPRSATSRGPRSATSRGALRTNSTSSVSLNGPPPSPHFDVAVCCLLLFCLTRMLPPWSRVGVAFAVIRPLISPISLSALAPRSPFFRSPRPSSDLLSFLLSVVASAHASPPPVWCVMRRRYSPRAHPRRVTGVSPRRGLASPPGVLLSAVSRAAHPAEFSMPRCGGGEAGLPLMPCR